VTVRKVAAMVGCSKNSVTKQFNEWLDETTEERREGLERERSRVIARLTAIADDARRGMAVARGDRTLEPADRVTAETKYMQQERQAWQQLSIVAGYNAPQRIEMSGGLTLPTDEEADKILAELDQLPPPTP
jgi:AraC-like DNA-binding protein